MNNAIQNLTFKLNVCSVKQKLSRLFGRVQKQRHSSYVGRKGPQFGLGQLTISALGELAFRLLQLGVYCLMLLALLRVLAQSLIFRQT